jgi:hypothetical protein
LTPRRAPTTVPVRNTPAQKRITQALTVKQPINNNFSWQYSSVFIEISPTKHQNSPTHRIQR